MNDDQRTDEDTAPQAGRDMLAQLQQMIDQVAEQAGPILRDVAIKAAELASVAGQKAGPLMHKAAEKTEMYGQKVAERSREKADEWRRAREATDQEDEPGAD